MGSHSSEQGATGMEVERLDCPAFQRGRRPVAVTPRPTGGRSTTTIHSGASVVTMDTLVKRVGRPDV